MPGPHGGGKTTITTVKTQTVKSAQPLAQEAREGLEEGREGQGEGSRAESPGAVGRSHTLRCSAANSVYKETSVPLLQCIVANYILARL